jgi:hypothetical protein
MENPTHDCVSELLERYLADLRERSFYANCAEARYTDTMRKGIKLKEMEALI